MNILITLKDLLISPRFITFYWTTGTAAVIAFLGMLTDIIPQLGLSEFGAVIAISVIGMLTKAINNYSQNKPMGFGR